MMTDAMNITVKAYFTNPPVFASTDDMTGRIMPLTPDPHRDGAGEAVLCLQCLQDDMHPLSGTSPGGEAVLQAAVCPGRIRRSKGRTDIFRTIYT